MEILKFKTKDQGIESEKIKLTDDACLEVIDGEETIVIEQGGARYCFSITDNGLRLSRKKTAGKLTKIPDEEDSAMMEIRAKKAYDAWKELKEDEKQTKVA